ncbi:MAG: hypothetical protein RLY31_1963 [Bacteroidota bacterium]|jgi:6-phosphogluconate dehydrogenase
MDGQSKDIGIAGLGVMGRNLLWHARQKGLSVIGYDKDAGQVAAAERSDTGTDIPVAGSPAAFVRQLRIPRIILLLVPAGAATDALLEEFEHLLRPGDILADLGNAYFRDTERRQQRLHRAGIHFLGVGISGGAAGARSGASIMPGGDPVAYASVQPYLEVLSATAAGRPCINYMGRGAAGHYVKMVHNGIEYAMMQQLAETYDLLRGTGGYDAGELHRIFKTWDRGKAQGYLTGITAAVCRRRDDTGTGYLLDQILDTAGQKGTGVWTSAEGLSLGVPIPTIDAAVSLRSLSKYRSLRVRLADEDAGRTERFRSGKEGLSPSLLEDSLYFGYLSAFMQGLHLLFEASAAYDFGVDLRVVIRTWQGGCIVRAALLADLEAAFDRQPGAAHLLMDKEIRKQVESAATAARQVVAQALIRGIPVPALQASLAYLDAITNGRLPVNLIQAQRDFFGAHSYERIDRPGSFHSDWAADQRTSAL